MIRFYCSIFILILLFSSSLLNSATVSDIKISDLQTLHTDNIRLEFSFIICNDSNEVSNDCRVILSLINDSSQEVITLEADIPPMTAGENKSISQISFQPTTSFLKWYWGKNPTMNYKIKQIKPAPAYSIEDEK